MSEAASGALYLIPVPLGDGPLEAVLPPATRAIAARLAHFVVEEPKAARRFLKQVGTTTPLPEIAMEVLDEHTPAARLPALIAPAIGGHDLGLLSAAGCPAVADPGAELVALAQQRGIAVKPLVGPSSLLLALMASGLDGQRFAFHGYLPADRAGRKARIAELERASRRERQTQMFIETPYRNAAMVADLLATCRPSTRLCIALDLTRPSESVLTRSVAHWRKAPPETGRRPAVFLLLA